MDSDLFDDKAILFEVVCDCTSPGDELIVAGNTDILGNWQPSKGLQLSTCKKTFPMWRGRAKLHLSELAFEWKLVCRRVNGDTEWEEGKNRRVSIQQMESHEAEFWLISAMFSGTHKYPVPWQSIACEGYELDNCANTCMAYDEYSEFSAMCGPVSQMRKCFKFWSGAQQLQKAGGPCEDAYFHGDHAMGIADGVESMAKHGVDSAAYAAQLMQLAAARTLPGDHVTTSEVTALECAVAALSHAEQGATAFGGSTAMVLALKDETIGVANLGDSGFLLLRRTSTSMTIIERSRGQQHGWNCPYQLIRLPPTLAARLPPSFQPDSAMDCERVEVLVDSGDLVLLFTDGLSDNLHEHELLEIVNRLAGTPSEPGCPEVLASELALAAHKRSLDPNAEVPFTLAPCKQGQENLGGRQDDITVVAAWIVSGGKDGVLHCSLPELGSMDGRMDKV